MSKADISSKAGKAYTSARDNTYVRRLIEDEELRASIVAAAVAAELEELAGIAHDSDCKPLKQFVRDETEAGSDGVMFHAGVKDEIKRILKEGK